MNLKGFVKRNGATILSITAMLGVIGTGITSAIAAKKSEENRKSYITYEGYWADNEEYAVPSLKKEEYTVKEYVKRNWKYYIPAVGCAVVTCSCIGLSDHLNKKRQAALISACLATTNAYKAYRESVINEYGEEKDEAIRTEIMEKQIKNDDIFIPTATDDEIYLFYDELSGEYFNATMERVVMMDGLECYILGVKEWG